jgi:hypothetical protein
MTFAIIAAALTAYKTHAAKKAAGEEKKPAAKAAAKEAKA